MKRLAFRALLLLVIGICFTVSAFADFYVIPVQKKIERVPKTGQTNCWNTSGETITCSGTGQDGEYQMGYSAVVAPSGSDPYTVYGGAETRFTDNSEIPGGIKSKITFLII